MKTVEALEKENESLRDRLRCAEEELIRARWDLDTAYAEIFELHERVALKDKVK